MILILAIFFVLFGFIVGSFLNVVIFRMNTHHTLGGRSKCMHCSRKLRWYDLVPVFSYLFLGGRCRSCQSRISPQYPVVEFITGLLFGLVFWRFHDLLYVDQGSFIMSSVYYLILISILMVVAVYDLRHKIIPDSLSLVFGLLTFAGLFFIDQGRFAVHVPGLWDVLSGFIISVPFALLWLVSGGRWMGLGDAKLAVGLGFMLGFSLLLPAMLVSFWTGALVGVVLMLFGRAGAKTAIPFAPFLIFGTLLVFLFQIPVLELFF